MELSSATSRRRALPFLASLLLTALLAVVATAQTSVRDTDGTTPLALSPGSPSGSYPLSGFESVNLYNGGLGFALPLAGVGGRGGAASSYVLPFPQRWGVRRQVDPSTGDFLYFPTLDLWESSLATPSPASLLVRRAVSGSINCPSVGAPVAKQTLTRVTFTAPDGTQYEMVDRQTGGQPHNRVCGSSGFSRGTEFVTTDGSSATFIADAPVADSWMAGDNIESPLAGIVILRDGTRYVFDADSLSAVRDRNGNMVTLSPSGKAATDPLGRQVAVTYVAGPPAYRLVTYPGFGGTTRTLRIDYANLGSVLRTTRPSDEASPKTEKNLFPDLNGGNTDYDPQVVSSVTLPDGQRKYKFFYNVYGELARVELPTGGALEYDYGAGLANGHASGAVNLGPAFGGGFDWHVYRRVTERRVYADGTRLEGKTTYGRPETIDSSYGVQTLGYVTTEQRDAAGALLGSEKHYFYGKAAASLKSGPTTSLAFSYPKWKDGREYQTEAYAADGTTLLRRENRTWAQPAAGQTWPLTQAETSDSARPNDPQVIETFTTLADTNQVSRRTYAYDRFGNVTDAYEYDFGPAGSGNVGPFMRRTHTDFKTAAAYVDAAANPSSGAGLRSLPEQQWVSSDMAGTTKVALTTYAYDQFAPEDCPQIVGHDGAYGTGFNTRGNLTGVTRYSDAAAGAGAVTTTTRYDIAGNAVSATNANGNISTVSYADNFSDSSNGRHTFAYPTSTTSAAPNPVAVPDPAGGSFVAGTFGSTTGFTAYTAYDFNTGLVTSATDANGKTTSYDYADPLDRLKRVDLPDGGRTTYDYADTHQCGSLVETRTLLDDAGREVSSWQFFDGLGRPYLSESWDGRDAANPYLRVDTRYDSAGRVSKVSNPYRTPGCGATPNPSGRWTTTEYDAIGRVTKVTTPDGARVRTEYAGAHVRVTDQANRQRVSISDGLGRLKEVWEVKADDEQPPDPWLESFTFPVPAAPGVPSVGTGYKTSYGYDSLGNLQTVTQGQQQPARDFTYDSLSRLKSASNPESGTVNYGYDANGNLNTKTDARGVTTTYVYDRLNRNVITHYAGGGTQTPQVRRHYDNAAAGANGLGRLYWTEAVGVSSTAFNFYDPVGRPTRYRQVYRVGAGWGQYFDVTRTYDRTGNVLTQTYPSGHAVAYNYDAAGRLGDNGSQPAFAGNLGDGVARTYASGLSYSEFGGLREERFGTQTPLYHKQHYNVRGQRYSVRLSTHPLASNEFDWNRGAITSYYDGAYTWGGAAGSTGSGPDNNGNVRRSETFIPGDEQFSSFQAFRQDYEYDALNRLKWVAESRYNDWGGQTTPSFRQAYRYDRWGNRTIDAAGTWLGQPSDPPSGLVNEKQFDVGDLPNTNRLYAPGDVALPEAQRLMRYDPAGNLVHDSYTGQGVRTYDAENRMTEAATDAQGNRDYYSYDAHGRRVKRKIAGEEWWQVYGMDGELLAEYRSGAATYLPSKEYGYRGGELLVTMSSGDDQRLRRFVQNLYYGALQRDPTTQELQGKINELAAAGAQGEPQLLQKAKDLARSLFVQTAYGTSPARSDAQYVTDLYYAYLHRAPDTQGLNHWAGSAAGGVSNRSYVCDAFQESPEFSALVSTLYGEAESDGQRRDRLIHVFHLGALGRIANTSELDSWRSQFDAAVALGPDEVKAKAELLGRGLFAAQVSDLSLPAGQFVTNLYEGFLQRGPDAGGLSFWTSLINNTTQSRQSVLNAFATCPPARELAGTLYRETFWLVSDHLGTPRMVADRTGSLASIRRHDYLPFGEEVSAGVGGRTTQQGYVGSNLRQRWAQLERDGETGLDYAQARYYSPMMGRFTGVDPGNAGAHEEDPQSWNGYAYVHNNPLGFTDPTGLERETCDDQGNCKWVGDFDGERSKELSMFKDGTYWNASKGVWESGAAYRDRLDPMDEFRFEMRRRLTPVRTVAETAFEINLALIPMFRIGRVGTATLGLGASAADDAGRLAVNLGRKLDYIFGKATGSQHNIDRSRGMLRELERIGLPDSPSSRQQVAEHLTRVATQPGVTQANGRVVRESLLWGPSGALKVKSIWEGGKLITAEILKPK